MEKDNHKKRYNTYYSIAFWITLFVALGLIVGGFFMPPTGEIDGSVLTSVGELFLWPALALGAKSIEDGRVAKLRFNNATIHIGEDKDNDGYDDSYEEENIE